VILVADLGNVGVENLVVLGVLEENLGDGLKLGKGIVGVRVLEAGLAVA
jgi:hypothetical protein